MKPDKNKSSKFSAHHGGQYVRMPTYVGNPLIMDINNNDVEALVSPEFLRGIERI